MVSYTYDTWGKLISVTGTLANTVGVKNPYCYRGYRYDTETGLYYCQSRYYNPEWGRWINADDVLGQPGELLSHNLFAYCANNPIILYDVDGQMAELIPAMAGAGAATNITGYSLLKKFCLTIALRYHGIHMTITAIW